MKFWSRLGETRLDETSWVTSGQRCKTKRRQHIIMQHMKISHQINPRSTATVPTGVKSIPINIYGSRTSKAAHSISITDTPASHSQRRKTGDGTTEGRIRDAKHSPTDIPEMRKRYLYRKGHRLSRPREIVLPHYFRDYCNPDILPAYSLICLSTWYAQISTNIIMCAECATSEHSFCVRFGTPTIWRHLHAISRIFEHTGLHCGRCYKLFTRNAKGH